LVSSVIVCMAYSFSNRYYIPLDRSVTNLIYHNSLSIDPNGNVDVCAFTIGNIYKENIDTIIERYDPCRNKMMKALMEGGVKKLVEYAENCGIIIDTSDCYSACSVCRKTIAALDRTLIS